MIDQLTVHLENRKGRLAALCRTLGDAGISMHSLTIADTERYGVVRIIADSPARAAEVLEAQGFWVSLVKVLAVEVPDVPGGLANLLDAIDAAGLNIEYAYCFKSDGGKAVDVLGIDDFDKAYQAVESIGYRVMEPSDLYS